MPGLPVITTPGTGSSVGALSLGISTAFVGAYRRAEANANAGRLGRIVANVPATTDHWRGAYFQSPPIPGFWGRGRNIQSKSFKDVGWTIAVSEWGAKVEWKWTDEMDDQTGSLISQGQGVGNGFWVRDESCFFQILNASTDSFGIQAAPNASDGAAMFSATDGASAARFGVTGGNLISGQSFSSGAGLRNGYQAALSRMFQFTDTETQPLLDPGAKNFLVIGAAADLAAYNEAFKQNMVAQSDSGATSNAGVSNVIFDAGYNVELWLTQRVSTGSMFVFNTDVPVQPLVRVQRSMPEPYPITMATDSVAKHTGIVGLQWVARTGYGVSLPYGAVKVTT